MKSKKSNSWNFIGYLLFIFSCIAICFWSEYIWGNTPIVYWSTSQNKCVKVMYDGIEKDCSEMPEKYSRVWVK